MSSKQIITAVGAGLLLFSWLSQQFLFERWNGRLADLRAALSTYQTYQSLNALFNAFRRLMPFEQYDKLWELQLRNYRYGLMALREALTKEQEPQRRERIEQQSAKYARGYSDNPEFGSHGNAVADVQAELEVLQIELLQEKQDIEHKKNLAQRVFWSFYILGSLLALFASLLPEVKQ